MLKKEVFALDVLQITRFRRPGKLIEQKDAKTHTKWLQNLALGIKGSVF